MSESSVPSPTRTDRFEPTSPTGWGIGALESKTSGTGRVDTVSGPSASTWHRWLPRPEVALTNTGPNVCRPHLVDRQRTAVAVSVPDGAATTEPDDGSYAACITSGRTTDNASVPVGVVAAAATSTVPPSRMASLVTPTRTVARVAGRPTVPHRAHTSSGAARTTRSGRRSPAPRATPTSPSAVARMWADVGSQ
jgi:hypothetical protein